MLTTSYLRARTDVNCYGSCNAALTRHNQRTVGLNPIRGLGAGHWWTVTSTLWMYVPSANIYFENQLKCGQYCWAPLVVGSLSSRLTTWAWGRECCMKPESWRRKQNFHFGDCCWMNSAVCYRYAQWCWQELVGTWDLYLRTSSHGRVCSASACLCLKLMMRLP